MAGLEAPLDTGPVRAEVTLVGDPDPDGRGGASVDVRLGGRRLRAVARASAAAALDDRLAGERVTVIGSVQRPGSYERFVRHRHLAGRLVVDTVVGWRPGDPVSTGRPTACAARWRPAPRCCPSAIAACWRALTLGDDRAPARPT